MSLSGHQSAAMKSDTWLTPPEILAPLGSFDLDPCCPPNMPWSTATNYFTSTDDCAICKGSGSFQISDQEIGECRACDGLAQPWRGRVWLNPPFGREAEKWLEKLAKHGNGIALVPARTETKSWFEHVWHKAHAVLFLKGRPHFHRPDGSRAPFNSGAPIALVAYSFFDADCLRRAELGHYVGLIR